RALLRSLLYRAPGDGPAVRLRWPIVDAEGTDLGQEARQGRVARDPQAATDLDRAVHDAVDRFGDVGLGDGRFLPGVAAHIEHPRRVPDGEVAGVDVDDRVRDHLLHHAQRVQALAEGLALRRAVERK